MLLSPSRTAFGDEADEADQARRRGMIPLTFRLQMKVAYAEREEKGGAPIVVSCERRGAVFATPPGCPTSGSKRAFFDGSIRVDVLVFRNENEDNAALERADLITNGKPLSGFEPVRARLTLREIDEEGEVIDVASLNLANYITGAHGSVTETVELQLGSVVELQVLSDLEKSLDTVDSESSCREENHEKAAPASSSLASRAVEPRKDEEMEVADLCEKTSEVGISSTGQESALGCSNSDHKVKPVAKANESEALVLERDENESLDIDHQPSHDSADSTKDASEFDSELEAYLMNNMYSNPPVDDTSAAYDASELKGSVRSAPGTVVSMVSKRHTKSEATTDGGNEELTDTTTHRSSEMADASSVTSAENDFLATSSADSDGSVPFGHIDRQDYSQQEDSDGEESGSCGEQNRIILPNHLMTSLVISRTPAEPYSSLTDEGEWVGPPIITEIGSSLPIMVWSIQGPEEIDPDEESDEMEMEDGTVVPKRNISKLQSGAAALNANSTTKASPPALPGDMSPLQRCYFCSTNVRRALYVALGKPLDMKTCTVLSASRTLSHTRVEVEDPPMISDSEGEEDRSDETDVESEVDRSQASEDYTVERTDTGFVDQAVLTSIVGPSSSIAESESEASIKIRSNASQTAELMNRINELEDDANSMKQALKKSGILVNDLQQEELYLKKLLGEHEERKQMKANQTEMSKTSIVALGMASQHPPTESDAGNVDEDENSVELRLAEEERDAACQRLKMLQAEVFSESNLRQENERLLTVILNLKRELDRESGVPDVLDMLKQAKSDLALERGRTESLQFELAQMQIHGYPFTPPPKKSKGFWASSSSKSKKASEPAAPSAPDTVLNSPRSVLET